MVLEVGDVVWANAGVAIAATTAIAPYRCDLMFRLRVVREALLVLEKTTYLAKFLRQGGFQRSM